MVSYVKVFSIFCLILSLVNCYPTTERSNYSSSEEKKNVTLERLRSTKENSSHIKNDHINGTDRGLYNPGLFEGDILLTPTVEGMQRNGIVDPSMLWPHGAIIYTIDQSVGCPGSWQCEMLTEAMDHLHEQGCVRFKQWTGEPHRVNIFINPEAGECWSPVGYTRAAEQPLSLGSSCWYRGIVLHELLHAVGFWHEMTRPDRDSFVNVYWDNIMPGFTSAFYKQAYHQVNTLGEHFDYRSVMMYDEYAFSKDGVSVTLKATLPDVFIGPIWKKNQLSGSDIRRLQKLYSCQGNTPLTGFPYDIQCSFNDNSCGFKNGGTKQWQWRRATNNDGFLTTILPSSRSTPGYLQSATFHPTSSQSNQLGCVRFWYYIESNSNSSYLRLLQSYLKTSTEVNFSPENSYELWTNDKISGSWIHVQLPLFVTQPFKLLFESSFAADATTGTIAIDDVELFYSKCDETQTRRQPVNNVLVDTRVYDIDIPLD